MKRAIKIALIILISITILFVLTGCGKEEKISTNTTIIEDKEIEKTETETEISIGEWKGNTYENDFLGIKFNLPQGWKNLTSEEITEMMNLGEELLNDDQKLAAEIAKLTSVYYMVANNPNTGDSVTILSEKLMTDVTEENYLNQLKNQLTSVESMEYEIVESSEENVAGKSYKTLSVNANLSGVIVPQKYYIYKLDNYMVCIIVTSISGESNINTIMKSFK